MMFQDFEQYFSTSRLSRYLISTENSTTKAIELYKANLKVAQAFHPLLGVLEVVLRNRLSDTLTLYFSDRDWIINQKTGFMSDPTLQFIYKRTGKGKTNDFLKREVIKAEQRLQKAKMLVTSGKIIAEQTFGFWSDLFEVHHYRILKGKPIQIFQTLPPGFGRKLIYDELDKVRRLRNRINHNEPIRFSDNRVDFKETLMVYTSIVNLLRWIEPELLKFLFDLDNVEQTIYEAEKSKF